MHPLIAKEVRRINQRAIDVVQLENEVQLASRIRDTLRHNIKHSMIEIYVTTVELAMFDVDEYDIQSLICIAEESGYVKEKEGENAICQYKYFIFTKNERKTELYVKVYFSKNSK
ncbi:MAG: hypothetical protein KJ971_08625, partial [Firmicutes bacterium]|nr:hypothetical protein [Bacillota bacterium]